MTDSKLKGKYQLREVRLLFVCALCFFGIMAFTLRPAAQQIPDHPVTLDVSVIEDDPEAYGSLTKDEFIVYEDKVKQQVISVKAQDAPISLGIALDASGSMHDQMPLIKKTAQNLISQMGAVDEAFVSAFTAKSELIQDFTSDHRELAVAVDKIYSSGATALLDAIISTSGHAYSKGKNRRKALVFITDGLEKGSFSTEDKAVKALLENQEQAYFICVPVEVASPFSSKVRTELKPSELVERISRFTGGQTFYLRDEGESASTVAKIVGILRHQYEVTYIPSNNKQIDKFHQVRVSVSPKDGRKLKVITGEGYYSLGHRRTPSDMDGAEKN